MFGYVLREQRLIVCMRMRVRVRMCACVYRCAFHLNITLYRDEDRVRNERGSVRLSCGAAFFVS